MTFHALKPATVKRLAAEHKTASAARTTLLRKRLVAQAAADPSGDWAERIAELDAREAGR